MGRRPIALVCLLLGACAVSDTPPPEPLQPLGASWSSKADAPVARTEVTAARNGRSIYVAGGFVPEGDATTARVDVYSIDDDEWSSGPDLPIPVNHAMSATVAGKVYVVGGY